MIKHEMFVKNMKDVINDIKSQRYIEEQIPQELMRFDDNIEMWENLLEHNEGVIAYEGVINFINCHICKLDGSNVIKLIQCALYVGNSVDYNDLLK